MTIVVVAIVDTVLCVGKTVHVALPTLESPAGITTFGEVRTTRRPIHEALQSQDATLVTII